MKIVFCGTPSFAVPTLKRVLEVGYDVPLVVTQPDRPSGRGMQLVAPPVKETALAAGIPVVQPEKIKNNSEFRQQLEAIAPDVILVVAYGRIIPRWMLDLPKHGNINLHASLLPRWRGAAPIQWSVAAGDTVTGNTTMRIDEGLDTGDILLQQEMPIAPDQTAADLFSSLAEQGAGLMLETLAGLETGTLVARKQDDSQSTLAPILTRENGHIDFSRTASEIYNRWRGFQPWPGAYTTLSGKKLAIHRLSVVEAKGQAQPGEIRIEAGRFFIACGEGSWMEVLELQMEGKKRMPVADFLRGAQLKSGQSLA